MQERHALEAELRFLGVPDHEVTLASLKARFTYPFWNLKEGKEVQPDRDGSVKFMVGGVRIRLHPDQFLTEDEYQKQGNSFKSEATPGGVAAETAWSYAGVDWNSGSVIQQDMGQGLFMVTDYIDLWSRSRSARPTAELPGSAVSGRRASCVPGMAWAERFRNTRPTMSPTGSPMPGPSAPGSPTAGDSR